MTHLSTSERLTQAILNKREQELSQLRRNNQLQRLQIESMQYYIEDLLKSRKILCQQIKDLVSNRIIHEN